MSGWREKVSNDTKVLVDRLIYINQHVQELDNNQSRFIKPTVVTGGLLVAYALIILWIQSEDNVL